MTKALISSFIQQELKSAVNAILVGFKDTIGHSRRGIGRTTRTRTVDPLHVMQVL